MNKSPSDFSYQSYEMFVGGQAAPPDGRSSVAGGGNAAAGGGGAGPMAGCCSSSSAVAGPADCCCCCNAHNGNSCRVMDEKTSLQSDDADESLTGCGVHGSRVRINGCVNRKVSELINHLFISNPFNR